MFVPDGESVLMVELASEHCNRSKLDNLPHDGKLVLYTILREDTIGCNVGGAHILYPEGKTKGVTGVVLYCHGPHGIIRNVHGKDFTSPQCKVDAIRKSANAVKQTMTIVFNRLFVDEKKQATRQSFGAFRVEFSVRCTSVREGLALLRKYLKDMGCEGMMSEDKQARADALLKFLDSNGLKLCAVPIELVMHSLIRTTRDFQEMIRCLKTDPKKSSNQKMAGMMEESEKRMLVRIHKELGQRKPSSAGLGQEIWSDIPREYLLEIIRDVYVMKNEEVQEGNEEGQEENDEDQEEDDEGQEENDGAKRKSAVYKLWRKDGQVDTKVIGHWDPMMAIAQGAWHALHNLVKTTQGRSKIRSVWSYCQRRGGFWHPFASSQWAGRDIPEDWDEIKSGLDWRVQKGGRLPGRCTIRLNDLGDIADVKISQVGKDRAQKFIRGNTKELDALAKLLTAIGQTKLGNARRWISWKGKNQDDVAFLVGRYKKRLEKAGWTCAFPKSWWTIQEEMDKCRSEVTY